MVNEVQEYEEMDTTDDKSYLIEDKKENIELEGDDNQGKYLEKDKKIVL